jgi:hypothetical protein
MKLIDVTAKFDTDDKCLDYIEKMRWPNGVREHVSPDYKSGALDRCHGPTAYKKGESPTRTSPFCF